MKASAVAAYSVPRHPPLPVIGAAAYHRFSLDAVWFAAVAALLLSAITAFAAQRAPR